MKIFVTGSAGFIGSHIADELTKQGREVLGIDNLSGGFLRNTKNHKFAMLDLRDKYSTERLIEQFSPTHLIHAAASAREIGSLFEPLKSTETNLLTYMNILNACIKNKIKKVILLSSMSVYGNQISPFDETFERKPEDVYAVNKTAMEQSTEILSEIHDFQYVIIRPRNVFGPAQALNDIYRNMIAIFMNRIMRNEPINIFGDGLQKRSPSYISFSLPCYIRCLNDDIDREIFNIGGLKEYTLNEIAAFTINAMKNFGYKEPEIVHLPDRPKEVKYAWATYTKAVEKLDYKEDFSIQEAILKMAQWAVNIGPEEWTNDKLELYNEKAPAIWK
jgi:UDP-glucose 4-epimerase